MSVRAFPRKVLFRNGYGQATAGNLAAAPAGRCPEPVSGLRVRCHVSLRPSSLIVLPASATTGGPRSSRTPGRCWPASRPAKRREDKDRADLGGGCLGPHPRPRHRRHFYVIAVAAARCSMRSGCRRPRPIAASAMSAFRQPCWPRTTGEFSEATSWPIQMDAPPSSAHGGPCGWPVRASDESAPQCEPADGASARPRRGTRRTQP